MKSTTENQVPNRTDRQILKISQNTLRNTTFHICL